MSLRINSFASDSKYMMISLNLTSLLNERTRFFLYIGDWIILSIVITLFTFWLSNNMEWVPIPKDVNSRVFPSGVPETLKELFVIFSTYRLFGNRSLPRIVGDRNKLSSGVIPPI